MINTSFGQSASKSVISAFHTSINNKNLQLVAGQTISGMNNSPAIRHGFYPLTINNETITPIDFDYFIAYPSPFTDQITVSFKKDSASISEINIHSITGALIHSQITNLETIYISTQSYAQGIYLISVSNSEEEFVTKKIIKL